MRTNRPILCRRASVVLELMVSLFVLLWLAFGTVEFGYYLYLKHALQGASRDGVRMAILPSATNATVQTAIANTMSAAGIAPGKYTWSAGDATTEPAAPIADLSDVSRGTPIRITITMPFGAMGVRPLGMIPESRPVTGMTTMVKE